MDTDLLQVAVSLAMYLAIFICGFIITITLGLTKSNFDGKCPLYAEIRWVEPRRLRMSSFGSASSCDYVIYIPLLVSILFPFIMLMFYGYLLYHAARLKKEALNRMKVLPLLAVNFFAFFLLLIAAGIVTTGRRAMCHTITDRAVYNPNQDSCFHAETAHDWGSDKFRTSAVIRTIITGEATLWVSLLFWLVLIGLLAWRFWNTSPLLRREQQPPTDEKVNDTKDNGVEKANHEEPNEEKFNYRQVSV